MNFSKYGQNGASTVNAVKACGDPFGILSELLEKPFILQESFQNIAETSRITEGTIIRVQIWRASDTALPDQIEVVCHGTDAKRAGVTKTRVGSIVQMVFAQ